MGESAQLGDQRDISRPATRIAASSIWRYFKLQAGDISKSVAVKISFYIDR